MNAMRTPVCELLGIDQPIVLAPMVAVPRLAAAVSNAGALGMLTLTWSEDVRAVVRETAALTARPFCGNLVLTEDRHRRLDQALEAGAADTAASRWNEKDQGIWEIRGEPRDFLYSKLMCWAALDRAIALAPQLGAENRTGEWSAARDEIRAAILERGWNEQAGAFTQAFGSEDLDASSLMLAITGFLPGDDPRMKATVAATAARLTDSRGLIYRYLAHDGLAGEEGTFLLCTFWLAHAQALAGELDQATATFERAVAAINDVGLLAEEVDPGSGEMIGNFPQAFSHIGLINAAWAIAQAQSDRTDQ